MVDNLNFNAKSQSAADRLGIQGILGDVIDSIASATGIDKLLEGDSGLNRLNATPDRLQRFVSPAGQEYVVKRGDTLDSIARANGTTWQVLQKLNDLPNANLIRPGQKIALPANAAPGYTVRSGDTLSGIASRFGSTVNSIARANGIENVNRIYPGDRLNIPTDGKVTAKAGRTEPGLMPDPIAPSPARKDEVRPANQTNVVARLGNVITIGEGNYESYNTGTKGVKDDKVGNSFLNPKAGTVTNMTINQIIATEGLSGYDKSRMFATGKYQTTIETLKLAKTAMGLTGNERYTPQMQERVFAEFLIQKAGGGKLADFIFKDQGTLESAQLAASKEWASIAVPAGYKNLYGVVSSGSISYYQKTGQNAANMTATNALRALLVEISGKRGQSGPITPPRTEPDSAPSKNGTIDGNLEARRQGIGVKSNAVRLGNLDANMAPVFNAVAQATRELGLPNPVITSGNDSRHKNGSLHYSDRALDFRGNNITIAQGQMLEDRVKQLLGGMFDVDFEVFSRNPSNNHLHVEFDPN